MPNKTSIAPKRPCGQKNRRVSAYFLSSELYSCIHYSVAKDGLYCVASILFGS